jgi:hypothetical protein
MDELAKGILRRNTAPLTEEISGEPWSVYIEHEKVIKIFQRRLLERIHKKELMAYWKWKIAFSLGVALT